MNVFMETEETGVGTVRCVPYNTEGYWASQAAPEGKSA